MVKYAPYYKRILSSVIDIALFYSSLVIIYLLYPESYDLRVNIVVLFLICIFYHFFFYKSKNQTFGEKYLGIKVIFLEEVQNKNFYYFIKALIISIVYFPFLAFKEGSISFILGSVLLQLYPKIREKKMLLWDLLSKTVVIDEKTPSI